MGPFLGGLCAALLHHHLGPMDHEEEEQRSWDRGPPEPPEPPTDNDSQGVYFTNHQDAGHLSKFRVPQSHRPLNDEEEVETIENHKKKKCRNGSFR